VIVRHSKVTNIAWYGVVLPQHRRDNFQPLLFASLQNEQFPNLLRSKIELNVRVTKQRMTMLYPCFDKDHMVHMGMVMAVVKTIQNIIKTPA